MEKKINYFAYGELKDGKILGRLLKRDMGEGEPAMLLGYQLCIQSLEGVPDYIPEGLSASAREIIRDNYGEGFRTYMVRRRSGAQVEDRIYQLCEEEVIFVDDWELTEFAWYEQNRAQAQTREGSVPVPVTVHADSTIPHHIERVVGGLLYPDLQDPEFMLEIAEKSRQESLQRLSNTQRER